MATAATTHMTTNTRQMLIEKLNEDLAREYQAIIAYVTYSKMLKGEENIAIANELEVHSRRHCKTDLLARSGDVIRQLCDRSIDDVRGRDRLRDEPDRP